MSHDGDDVTPSVDRVQPQHVVRRPHAQIRAAHPDTFLPTGDGIPPLLPVERDDDAVVKMASRVTADVIGSALHAYAAEQSATAAHTASSENQKQFKSTPTSGNHVSENVSSDANHPTSLTESSVASGSTGVRPPVADLPDPKPEVAVDAAESKALEDISRLQAVTRQLRAAVAESRSADGLSVDVVETNSTRRSQQTNHQGNDGGEVVDDFNPELVSQSKQSRSEKKARKALCKLGLKPVAGIAQVTIKRKKNSIFVISRPDVFVNSSSDTYVVFGEACLEDPDERAKQEAAKRLVDASEATVRQARNSATESASGYDGNANTSDEENVDEAGIPEQDIDLVISQAGVSRSRAVRALRNNDKDIVNAVMVSRAFPDMKLYS